MTTVLAAAAATHCAATALTADIDDEIIWRGACLGCGWVAEHHADDEKAAVEQALDHSHLGWRDLPTVHRPAGSTAGHFVDIRRLAETLYPTGWPTPPGPPGPLDPDSPLGMSQAAASSAATTSAATTSPSTARNTPTRSRRPACLTITPHA